MIIVGGCEAGTAGRQPVFRPAAVPIRPARAATIDSLITQEMAKRRIAGLSLAVLSNGNVLFARGYGHADVESGRPVTPQTPFLIASQTKMFTAVAVMMLVEQRRLDLDDRLETLLDVVPPGWGKVTVRQLLNHTSGVPGFASFETPPCGRSKPEADYVATDVLSEVSCLPLAFVPGTDWSYSDTGYHLLGLIIKQASGQTYEQFLSQQIFTPLRMTETRLMAPPGERDGRAVGYRWRDGRFEAAAPLYPLIEMSTGGLVSTVLDLARFDAALASGALLPEETLERMWKPTGIGSALYGMGFAVRPVAGMRQVGHTGGGPGAATSFARFTDHGITVIALTNTAQPPQTIQEIVGQVAETVLK